MTAPIAVLDPSAGISGDMTLGALIGAGVTPEWLRGLPARLGFPDVAVRIETVQRASLAVTKVDFDIPESSNDEGDGHHGHHVGELIERVRRAPISDWVMSRAVDAFRLIGRAEGTVHGVDSDRVHLHEVGAIDAVLDIVGAIEGFEQLEVEAVYNLPVAAGTGWVRTAHGELPVPAPATALLLEGVDLCTGGPVEGEATTPTGAALIRVLSAGPPPTRWRLTGVSWGGGTRNPTHYANALRLMTGVTAAESSLVDVLTTDIDDMQPEYIEPLRSSLLSAGALDCFVWMTHGKKGRTGFRIEVLAPPEAAQVVGEALFRHSTTVGYRRTTVERKTLRRKYLEIEVAPSVPVRVKIVEYRGHHRVKPEYEDVKRAADLLKRPALEIAEQARREAERRLGPSHLAHESEERKPE